MIDYERAVHDFGDRIFHVHAKDLEIRRDGLYRHGTLSGGIGWQVPRLPGLGEVDWAALRRRALRRRLRPSLSIEHEDRAFEGDGRARPARLPDRARRAAAAAGVSFELITMGRIGVDLYPEQIGVPLAEVRTFRKMLGGTATNVAVAAARLGRRTAVITKVGDDPFGGYIRGALREFGVDDRFVGTDPFAADAAGVLRDPPAGRLPAALLPPALGPRSAARDG